jgi:hypothetical protein
VKDSLAFRALCSALIVAGCIGWVMLFVWIAK